MFPQSFLRQVMALLAMLFVPAATAGPAYADESVRYSTQIAPILQKYCVSCHSRVEAQNGLSLQAPDDILKGSENGLVLNADTPAKSRLLEVLLDRGADQMPPADQPQPSATELGLLRRWLEQGAEFDSRMAVLPVLPEIPVTAEKQRSPALSMTFAADGSSVFAGRFRSVEQRNASTQNILWRLLIPDGKVNSLRLSSDGNRLLAATGTPGLSGRAVEVIVGGTEIHREYSGHNDILYAAEWSPDGRLVATAGYDRRIILHDAETGRTVRELTGHNGAIFDLRFSPDGTLLASASADATIKIWHVASGERFDTLSQPQAEQYSVRFSPDGRFIYGAGADSRIRQWQLVSIDGPQINPLLISRFADEGAISRLEMTGDGKFLVSASDAGSIKIWDSGSINEQSADKLSGDLVSCLAVNDANASVLVATSKGEQKSVTLPDRAVTSQAKSELVMTASITSPGEVRPFVESEPNDNVASAQKVEFPAMISGVIHREESAGPGVSSDAGVADTDTFRFAARKGEAVLIEVKAFRAKSALDSVVEVLTTDGAPVMQAQLQAVRDSYFTFRGKDSDTSDDFRVFNWQEMELNEYLYADGEVVRLWLYPRGPDSGFKVYPGFGSRQTYFGTTPTSHPLQGPAFIVVPHAPDAELKNTGLPVFPIYYENDDDSMRQWGKDSRLHFVPPADGDYIVRLRDARGFQGKDFTYQLLIRSPQPDFSVAMTGTDLTVYRGTGREIGFTVTRLDGYNGPVEIYAENLPEGFSLSDPVLIQSEQRQAFASLIASNDAVQPSEEAVAMIRLQARAQIGDREVVHPVGSLKSLKLGEKPKVLVKILSAEQQSSGSHDHAPELTVWAGETVRAFLKVERLDHNGLVEFGKEDSGRNLPHGVFVDNIGLNGLMLLDGQSEREFFITTAKWVPEGSRPFYLRSNVDGGITSLPVMLHVRHRTSAASK